MLVKVKMDRAVSGGKPMLAGVPQGFTLSPMLYIRLIEGCPNWTFPLCGGHLYLSQNQDSMICTLGCAGSPQ